MSDHQDRIDELYAEGDREAPPAALDRAILAAAREPFRRPWYRQPHTLTGLAMAASVVLAAMVVYYAPLSEEAGFASPRDPAAARVRQPTAPPEPAGAMGLEAPSRDVAEPAAKRTATARDRAQEPPETVAELMTTAPAAEAVGVARATRSGPATPEQVLAALAQRCGPLPGGTETRRLAADATGWYLEVRGPEATRYWRCMGNRWQTFPGP